MKLDLKLDIQFDLEMKKDKVWFMKDFGKLTYETCDKI